MVEIDKTGYELSLESTDVELSFESKKIRRSKNKKNENFSIRLDNISERFSQNTSERQFPSTESITIRSQHSSGRHNFPPNNEPGYPFRIVFFEQGLKALATLYVSIGLVASAVFLSRQVVIRVDVANKTWKIVGIVKGILSIFVIICGLWYRMLLRGHSHYQERINPDNPIYFYTYISITSTLSFLYFILMELRNYNYWNICAVSSDMIIPITQIFFIIIVVMVSSDLIFFKIKDNVPIRFYIIYKSTAVLLFANCINCLMFDLFDSESRHLQIFVSNGSLDVFCYGNNSTSDYVALMNKAGPILQVFTLIFFISSIAILIKPLRKLSKIILKKPEEEQFLLSYEINRSMPLVNNPEYSSFSISLCLVLCIFTIAGVPLDLMETSGKLCLMYNIQITFHSLPMFIYVLTGIISIYTLKLLYLNFTVDFEKSSSKSDSIILWLSLFGQITSCFNRIINNSQFLTEQKPNTECPSEYMAAYITGIILYSGSILQSMVQAMALGFISQLKKNYLIKKRVCQKLANAILILISCNIGFFITNLYLLSDQTSFKCYNDPFNTIVWDLLNSVSEPLTLIFRGYAVLFLLRFLKNLQCQAE